MASPIFHMKEEKKVFLIIFVFSVRERRVVGMLRHARPQFISDFLLSEKKT